MTKITLETLESILTAELGERDSLDDLLYAARDEDMGLCIACLTPAYGVEPDARRYQCDDCMKHTVYGIEELAMSVIA